MVPSKDVKVLKHDLFRRFLFAPHDVAGHFSGHTGTEADKAFMIFAQVLFINARLIVKAFNLPNGNKLHEVLVPCPILSKKDQMIELAAGLHILYGVGTACNIDFAANNGLDSLLDAFLIEFDGTIHDTMIGNGKGRHSQLLGITDKIRNPAGPIKEAELRMGMEMDKLIHKGLLINKKQEDAAKSRSTFPSSNG